MPEHVLLRWFDLDYMEFKVWFLSNFDSSCVYIFS